MPKNQNSKKGTVKKVFENPPEHDISGLLEPPLIAVFAKKLKSDGMSVADIAEKLNLSKGKIYEYLRD